VRKTVNGRLSGAACFATLCGSAALLAGAAILGAPTPAQATPTYAVEVFDDGVLQGGITVIVAGNSLTFFGSTSNFSVSNGSGVSNNPGTPVSSNLDLSNNEQIAPMFGAAGGTHTIEIVLSQTGWVAPAGTPLNLSSSSGGSVSDDGGAETVSASYQGFLDNTNTLFGEPAAGATPVENANDNLGGIGTAALVFSPSPSMGLVSGGTPFSLTDVMTFTFTLSPGSGQDTANDSASTDASPVPEPASLTILGGALVGLGWLGGRRRNTV
jgi:hypothetical protein